MAEHKKYIQRAIGNADMVKSIRICHPLNFLIEKAIPVKKYGRQGKETDSAENS